jgi:iron complex transport system ATP-binding protein
MHAIEAIDVEYRYGAHIAVGPSSFTVPVGAITALIGPNGSGKSTILSGIAGLLDPTSGSIQVHQASSQKRIALVLQTTKVNEALPITVRETVTMGRYPGIPRYRPIGQADRSIVDSAMGRMAITDLQNRHIRDLSGGERQRVFVAQGLAQDHDILLLDEPLTGLDLGSAQAIDAVIHEEQAVGRTIVMSTHDLAEAQVADHVILMASRVVASGTPEEALAPPNLREAYGASLLHVNGDKVFLDDPAHQPTQQRHVHQDRSIHVETNPDDQHGS